jgi:hypothetical protein
MMLIHNSKEGTTRWLQAEIMRPFWGTGLSVGARQLSGGHMTDNSLPLGFLARNFSKANRADLRKKCTFLNRKKPGKK